MSYLALYRKYRPISFDDVFGQEEIVTVIKNSIVNNKISHAYLFSGPRGTGKTTIAKIIARLVNCEGLVDGNPCGKCYNCLNFNNSNDIVEIDAASNNGVDEIRELRDKVNLVPSNAKYKVYIIDEVHMLTNQAFNALLKTLEEPPAHVIFILATTEPHKIPLTISSRCQKFRFSKIDDEKIVERLKYIAKNEKIKANDDVFYEIARLSDGCMRDAINLFDQLAAYGNNNISLEDIYKTNGSVSYEEIELLMNSIINNNKTDIIEFISKLTKSGKSVNKFIEELMVFLKDLVIYKTTSILSNIQLKNEVIKALADKCDDNMIYSFIEKLYDVLENIKTSSHEDIIFMTSLIKFSQEISNNSNENIEEKKEIISQEIIKDKEEDNENKTIVNSKKENPKIKGLANKDIDIRVNNTFALASRNCLNEYNKNWKKVEEYIYDNKFSSVAGLLKDSEVVAAGDQYIIVTSSISSVVERINEEITKIEKLLEKIYNKDIFVVALTSDVWKEKKQNYVKNIKSNIKYEFIEYSKKKEDKKKNTPVDDLIDLIGDSVIEYK